MVEAASAKIVHSTRLQGEAVARFPGVAPLFKQPVFAITQRNTPRDMFRYGLYCFSLFMGGLIVAGWLMWALRH